MASDRSSRQRQGRHGQDHGHGFPGRDLALASPGRVDLDVEEPNCIFLRPEITSTESVPLDVPVVDESKCNLLP